MPLPEIGSSPNALSRGVHALIRRADIPLDVPTDEAWAIVDESVLPAVTRGAWRGNGLRVGVLGRERFDAYTNAMPEPVALGQGAINQSPHPTPIIETARLSPNLRFDVDLTRPPSPRQVEQVVGGKSSTLRLLARIETDNEGRHILVVTPHHYIPSPYDLIPRNPLVKELDGRVFNELTIRVPLEADQLAVIGLYWPWPEVETFEPEPGRAGREEGDATVRPAPVSDAEDPAAPPPHITGPARRDTEADDDAEPDQKQTGSDGEDNNPDGNQPRVKRAAPPLPAHFGSTLLTGTRIRQQVRTVLLISIIDPGRRDATEPAAVESP